MDTAQEIFSHYLEGRNKGLAAPAVLEPLRTAIMQLAQGERHQLAHLINASESQQKGRAVAQAANHAAPPKQPHPAVSRIHLNIDCPRCGKANKKDEVLCFACGDVLKTEQVHSATRTLLHTDELFFRNDFFGENSVMSLQVRGSTDIDLDHSYEIRPQEAEQELVIGRSIAENNAVVPDIDLMAHHAEKRGVSRLHLSLRYDPKHRNIRVMDMNSVNGSFINGQRLHPNEVRILRNGDELRLGKLVLKVVLFHVTEFSESAVVTHDFSS